MAQTVYEIDGANSSEFAGDIAVFNRVFLTHVGSSWPRNLHAFDGYRSGLDGRSAIRWINASKARTGLGHLDCTLGAVPVGQ